MPRPPYTVVMLLRDRVIRWLALLLDASRLYPALLYVSMDGSVGDGPVPAAVSGDAAAALSMGLYPLTPARMALSGYIVVSAAEALRRVCLLAVAE